MSEINESVKVSQPPAAKSYRVDKSHVNGKITDQLLLYRYRLIGVENQLIHDVISLFRTVFKEIDLLFPDKSPFLAYQLNAASHKSDIPFQFDVSKDIMPKSPLTISGVKHIIDIYLPSLQAMVSGLLDKIDHMIWMSQIEIVDTTPKVLSMIIYDSLPREVRAQIDLDHNTAVVRTLQNHLAQDIVVTEAVGKKNKLALQKHYNKAIARVGKQLSTGLQAGKSITTIRTEIKSVLKKHLSGPAAKLARTQVQHMATQAAKEFYIANQSVVESEIWLATLDAKSLPCLVCANLDGQEFKVGQGPQPVTDTHPNCRCLRVPKVKSWEELGIDPDTIPEKAKKQVNGLPPERQTFADWFFDQDEDVQRELLGATRYELYAGGDLDITDFVKNNKLLSIKQLRKRYGVDV